MQGYGRTSTRLGFAPDRSLQRPLTLTARWPILRLDEPLFRHQVFDVPVVKYTVVEHRLFGGVCPTCEGRHHGVLPRTVPSGQMGPNLVALIAKLSGDEQLSIRKIRKHLIDHFDLTFSVGAISQAQGKMNATLAAPYRAIGEFVRSEPVVHADETRHFRGNNPYWLWVLAVGCACYFVTHYSRGKAAADAILGNLVAYLVTDDYIGYANHDDAKRQLCWAHLLRQFVDIGSRTGRGGVVGRRLHAIGPCVFRVRHRFEQGRCTELQYVTRMNRLRRNFSKALDAGIALQADGRTHHQCRHLANREAMLWTFMKDHRIPLTSNLAERALRPY